LDNAILWQQICDVFFRYSVPIFVLISGFKYALSAQHHPETTYFEHITRRALRLLRPYLIWTAIVYFGTILINRSIPTHGAYANFPWISPGTAWNVLNGSLHPAYQLWFVPMLFLVIVLYPPIHKASKWWISQPVLWSLFVIIRMNHVQIPMSYPAFLAFFDLGARLADSGHLEFHLKRTYGYLGVFCLVLYIGFAAARLGFIETHHLQPVRIGQELTSSLSIFFLFGYLFHKGAPGWIVSLRHYVWPVFIMHEPFILGKIAWRIYIQTGLQSPLMYPVTATAVLITAGMVYFLMRKAKIHRYLF